MEWLRTEAFARECVIEYFEERLADPATARDEAGCLVARLDQLRAFHDHMAGVLAKPDERNK